MTERVSLSVDGYDLEYSLEPVRELLSLARRSEPYKSLGGTGWSGRVHSWALTPAEGTDRFDPSSWCLTATEPDTGMVGSIEFDGDGRAVAMRVSDMETLSHGGPLRALIGGWTNALSYAGPDKISSQGDILFRRTGEAGWQRSCLRVGSECGSVRTSSVDRHLLRRVPGDARLTPGTPEEDGDRGIA